jgi:hypothetical protein
LGSPHNASGEEVDPRLFTEGRPIDLQANLHITKRQRGRSLDFTLADFDMPVVSAPLANLLLDVARDCIQLLPAQVEDEQDEFFILNVTRTVPCISDAHSGVMRWNQGDGRPEKVGQYRMVVNPVLTAASYSEETMFRAAGWQIMLLASDNLARVLLNSGLSGLELATLPTLAGDA